MHVLLISTTTGYQTRAFAEAGERAGIRLTLATDRCKTLDDPWRDAAIPVRFHDLDGSVRTVASRAGRDPFTGVLALGDRPVELAAALADRLQLRGHSIQAARASRDKRLLREAVARAGLPAPRFRVAKATDNPRTIAAATSWPCVIKPLVLSGSRGVMRADDPAAFVRAFERLCALLRSHQVRALRDPATDTILIEDYVPGDEYAVEGLLDDGRLRILAIFDKPDPLDGPFFEETIYVTPSRALRERQAAIADAVAAAVSAVGLSHGPVHAECRVTRDMVYVLEVAARPIGGLCARALRFDGPDESIGLEGLLLRHAAGADVAGYRREASAAGVMMMPIQAPGVFRRIDGVDEARLVPGIEDVRITAKPDQVLVPLPEGASYLGFIFARAGTPEDVGAALRAAHARLSLIVDRQLPIAASASP
jgi:biotin carboxylase